MGWTGPSCPAGGTWAWGAPRLEIHARFRRPECPAHGVRVEGVLLTRHRSALPHRFESLVAWLATRCDASAWCVSTETMGRICGRVVADELDGETSR